MFRFRVSFLLLWLLFAFLVLFYSFTLVSSGLVSPSYSGAPSLPSLVAVFLFGCSLTSFVLYILVPLCRRQ